MTGTTKFQESCLTTNDDLHQNFLKINSYRDANMKVLHLVETTNLFYDHLNMRMYVAYKSKTRIEKHENQVRTLSRNLRFRSDKPELHGLLIVGPFCLNWARFRILDVILSPFLVWKDKLDAIGVIFLYKKSKRLVYR